MLPLLIIKHTLFTLENSYGLTVSETDGEVCLKVNKGNGKDAHELLKMLYAWKEQAEKLSTEDISKEEYDNWRYHYPKFNATQGWGKVPSQELSNALVGMFQDQLKPDKQSRKKSLAMSFKLTAKGLDYNMDFLLHNHLPIIL